MSEHTKGGMSSNHKDALRLLLDSRSKFAELYVCLTAGDLSTHDLKELCTTADQGGLAIDAFFESCKATLEE